MTDKTLAVVFPGQGSQSIGMLADIAREFPVVEATFAEASYVLGYDVWQLAQTGPAEELDKTVNTQPVLLTAGVAVWKILTTQKKLQPAMLAGHSLGEYTALVCAEAIAFADALKLVKARGEFMQDALPLGQSALAAIIGLDDAAVKKVCADAIEAGEVLSAANFNCPGQVVIAGNTTAVERAIGVAKTAGARLAKMLPVSVASHCALMQPAVERLTKMLAQTTINTPVIPVVNNVDVAIYKSAAEIREGLARQLVMPVRWVEIIEFFAREGITHIIECGPGKVLSGLNKRIVADMKLSSVAEV
jgi:[acyl-carrier-protein] S-malonyltransferase